MVKSPYSKESVMKRWILILLAVLGAGGLLWFASDKIRASKTGDGGPKPDFMAGSQVWIEGNSSLRRYSMDMGMISAKSDLNRVLKVDALLTLIQIGRASCRERV